MTHYKIVEASTVTDEALERIVNEWVGQGWVLDGIQFAMRESSKRPAMAFVVFTREAASGLEPLGRTAAAGDAEPDRPEPGDDAPADAR